MTSSQALLLNLFGPLSTDFRWLLSVIAELLCRTDLLELKQVEIEFAPAERSRYLGDMTRVDVFLLVWSATGFESVVIELKYTDRFSSRRVDVVGNLRYHDLARSVGLWREPELAMTETKISQLLRCHALGARTLQVEEPEFAKTTLLLVSHPLDEVAQTTFAEYQGHLNHTDSAVSVGLDQFLKAANDSAPSTRSVALVEELQLRYLRHEESEQLWQEFTQSDSTPN